MTDAGPLVSTGAKDFGAVSNNRGVVAGDASGHAQVIGAQTNIYDSSERSERPESPPSPSCTIPFRRDPDFVDRGTLLDQISERCSAPASRIALVGLGGVGKSQLAIEHCYRTANRSPMTWIFWAHASNAARLEESYRDIADQVKLRGRRDPQADVFKLVHDWLRNKKNGKWLLVLDNADDADVFLRQLSNNQKARADGNVSTPQHNLLRYLPQSAHGSVLVTSRTRMAASQLIEERDIIQIEPMRESSARFLLCKKLGDEINKDSIDELAAALEFMPLALAQAAAHIRKRAPRCSVRQYLEEFHRSDQRKTSLLNREAGHLRRDEEAKNSIITTWQISFDHLRRTRQSAANLLSLMSFFDRQGIPKALLYDYVNMENRKRVSKSDKNKIKINDNDNDSEADTDDGFEDDVLALRDYSFITVTADANTFEMHRLVQLATRKWLEHQGQLERWKQQYITNLCAAFPVGDYENWGICQPLFPHARSALAQKPKDEVSLKQWSQLLYNAAWYMIKKGNVGEAEKLSVTSMQVSAELFGKEHMETLNSMDVVAQAIELGGRWNEAAELKTQVMEILKKVRGEDDPDTLTSIANLASTYIAQSRWKEAEQLLIQIIEKHKRAFGEEHDRTLISLGDLALTYANQGRWNEAEELVIQVIEMKTSVFGEEHPETLLSTSNLAAVYYNQGRWNDAEALHVQVLETRKRVLGEEHPNTLLSISYLAAVYYNQGRWKDAEALHVQVLETRKRVLGEEHPHTLNSKSWLARVWQSQGRKNDAIILMEDCYRLQQQVLGFDHRDTAQTFETLREWQSNEEFNGTTMRHHRNWRDVMRKFRRLRIAPSSR